MYETIASPIEYGGIRLKNRIIFAPTTMGLKQEDYCEKIRQIAAGGCATVSYTHLVVLGPGDAVRGACMLARAAWRT